MRKVILHLFLDYSQNVIIWRDTLKFKNVVCIRDKKEVFIYKESIVYPLVEMIPKHNTKDGLFYLSNNQYVEILNYVQYTLMSALF